VEQELLDARGTRLDDVIIAVALLGAFAFDVGWVIILVTISTVSGAFVGLRGAPVVRIYHSLVAPNLAPASTHVDPAEWQFAAALDTIALTLAIILISTEAAAIGWMIALGVAVLRALDVAAGISLGGWVYRRIKRRSQ
jgi:hypothetical protein